MILRVLKYCIPIYLVLAVLLLSEIRGGRSWDAVLILLGLIAAITVLGLILGMVACVLVRVPAYELAFYAIGQVVAFGFMVYPFLSILFSC
jgi:hypothetical protein